MSGTSIHPNDPPRVASFEIRHDDVLLTIDEYCSKWKRSRPSYYRDKAAGRFHVVMIGGKTSRRYQHAPWPTRRWRR